MIKRRSSSKVSTFVLFYVFSGFLSSLAANQLELAQHYVSAHNYKQAGIVLKKISSAQASKPYWFLKAKVDFQVADYEGSKKCLAILREQYVSTFTAIDWQQYYYHKASILIQEEKFEQAQQLCARILSGVTSEFKMEFIMLIMQCMIEQDQRKAAKTFLKQHQEFKELPRYQYWVCFNFLTSGNYDSATYYLEKVNTYLEEQGDDHSPFLLKAYRTYAYLKSRVGDLQASKHYYEYIVQKYQEYYSHRHYALITIYHNLGWILRETKYYDEALVNYNKSLHILRSYFGEDSHQLGDSYNNIGNCYLYQSNFDSAEVYLFKSLHVRKRLLEENHYLIAYCYQSLGACFDKQGQHKRAQQYYDSALINQRVSLPKYHPELGETYMMYANSFLQSEQYIKAIDHFNDAFQALYADYQPQQRADNPPITYVGGSQFYLNSFKGKAQAFMGLFSQYRNKKYLKQAYACYQDAIKLFDTLAIRINTERSKLRFAQTIAEINDGAVECAYACYKNFGDVSYLQGAFKIMERSKARVLQGNLQENQAKKFGGIPNQLLLKEYSLRNKIAELQVMLDQNRKVKRADSIRHLLQYNRIQYAKLLQLFEENYPTYFALKHQKKTLSVTKLQEYLSDDQAFITWQECANSIYLIYADKQQVRFNQLNKPDSLVIWVDQLHQIIRSKAFVLDADRSWASFSYVAHQIYQTMFQSIDQIIGNKRLIVSPEGKLALIPFELLLRKPVVQELDYKNIPYILKTNSLTYVQSATLWHNLKGKPLDKEVRLLAMAPSFQAEDESSIGRGEVAQLERGELVPLLWSKKEIERISSYFTSKTLLNNEASKENFMRWAPVFNVIHIASHALVSDENPTWSRIFFSAGSKEDSLAMLAMHTFELYNMELNAKMITLSACNTGYGKIIEGEGVMSLARGFMYAGCPSIVMSLWPANDRTTAELMELFYKNLAEGMPKDLALQQAKIVFLERADHLTAHPYFWSTFVINGDERPIIQTQNSIINQCKWWCVAIIIIIVASLLGGLMYQSKWLIKRYYG